MLHFVGSRDGCGVHINQFGRPYLGEIGLYLLSAEHAIAAVPGSRGGGRLTLTAQAGVVVARGDPNGMVT